MIDGAAPPDVNSRLRGQSSLPVSRFPTGIQGLLDIGALALVESDHGPFERALRNGEGGHRVDVTECDLKATRARWPSDAVAMLSSVLNSERAVEVNILIMRAFVKLRQLLATHADLARKLDALERKYDAQFKVIFDAIRESMRPPEPRRRAVGFRKS